MCYPGEVFLFDVDGTLTPPRQPMGDAFAYSFRHLVKDELVYIVSGSDIRKIREQVPEDILNLCDGVFGSSGNELWIGEEKVYSRDFRPSTELLTLLKSLLHASEYEVLTGNHLEYRPGMLNFSIVGRNASLPQRKQYHAWDRERYERTQIATTISRHFPDLGVAIGGEISVDIYPHGMDKSQSVAYIREKHPDVAINFFGDKTSPQGNDYSAVCALGDGDRVFSVKDYQVTEKIINAFLEVKYNERTKR